VKNAYKILVEKSEGKEPFVWLGVVGRIILKLTLKNYYMRMWIGFICLRIENTGKLF
jgi:hypothetical protein